MDIEQIKNLIREKESDVKEQYRIWGDAEREVKRLNGELDVLKLCVKLDDSIRNNPNFS